MPLPEIVWDLGENWKKGSLIIHWLVLGEDQLLNSVNKVLVMHSVSAAPMAHSLNYHQTTFSMECTDTI